MQKLEVKEFKDLNAGGYAIADTRKSDVFADGYIKESVSVPFDDNFLQALEDGIGAEQKVLLVADEADVPAIAQAIKGAGLTNVAGYLGGGFDAWKEAGNRVDMLICIDEDEFSIDYQFDEFYLVDVRAKEDFENEHVEDAESLPLIDVGQFIVELDNEVHYYIYGNTAAEAITAGSLFRKDGFQRVRVIAADYEKIKGSNIPFFKKKKNEA